MSLRIDITNDRTLAPADEKIWVTISKPGRAHRLIQANGRKTNSGQVGWEVSIEKKRVACRIAVGSSVIKETSRYFSLRPGTIILDDPNDCMDDPSQARARSFRTQRFQEFLDRYEIYAVRHCNLKDKVFVFQKHAYHAMQTTAFYTNGSIFMEREDPQTCRIIDADWVLERRVSFDADGHVLEAGYILYTSISSLDRLEESFEKRGILPAR